MLAYWKKIPFLWLALAARAQDGIDIDYLDEDDIAVAWTFDTASAGVGEGNGAFVSPDGNMLVIVSSDAKITALDAETGELGWTYQPTEPSTSTSGAFFNMGATTPYIAYSVVSGGSSKVITLDMGGTLLFETATVEGIAQGTPVTTADGKYILTTHNTGGDTGHFSVFDADTSGMQVFQYSADISTFGGIGYYHNPELGYFPGGEGNTNDVFIWSAGIPDDFQGGNITGQGQLFAWQLPALNNVTLVGPERGFLTDLAPVISNKGYYMHMSVTISESKAWTGTGLRRASFSTRPKQLRFSPKATPRFLGAKASPTLSNLNELEPTVYGPTAVNQIYRTNFDFSEAEIIVETTSPLSNKVLVSIDDQFIYYATNDGSLYQLDGADLSQQWNVTVGAGVAGEIAQSNNGMYVYTADVNGVVSAFQVTGQVAPTTTPPGTAAPTTSTPGNITGPPAATTAPTPEFAPPTDNVTIAPTMAPDVNVTLSPTSVVIDTFPPTPGETTAAPSAMATEPPVAPPVMSPAPTSSPTAPTSSAGMAGVSALVAAVVASGLLLGV